MNYNKKHSKIKNTGILFELLTRQITVDVLNGTEDSKDVKILNSLLISCPDFIFAPWGGLLKTKSWSPDFIRYVKLEKPEGNCKILKFLVS